jgi:hypothetical protein
VDLKNRQSAGATELANQAALVLRTWFNAVVFRANLTLQVSIALSASHFPISFATRFALIVELFAR